MIWRINLSPDANDHLDRPSDTDRAAVLEEPATWVDYGPHFGRQRHAAGQRLVEDHLAAGYTVIYFNHPPEDYITVVYIGRPS